VRGWLSRAEAESVRRGRAGWWAPWARWWRRQGPIEDAAFQAADEPYPRHWRRPPEPWRASTATGDDAQRRLRDALDDLPVTWRHVVTEHDIGGRADPDVARDLDLTEVQERSILARARAALRDRLDRTPEEGERE
jgi:DNA-directed RNA polymerase specialized sigma24 family protein